MGTVVSNNDPLRVGRVRIRIYGVHSDDVNEIPESALPWASCVVPTTEDGVSGLGRSPMLKAGALVFGFFLDGCTSQQPLVVGSVPRIEVPTEQQEGTTSEFDTVRTTTIAAAPEEAASTSTDVPTDGASTTTDTLIGTTNTEKGYNYLIGLGYSPVSAAAVIGNFIVESNMVPTTTSAAANESSYGIAQWNPDAGRLQQLQSFATDRGLDFNQLSTQLQFFHHDFSTLSPRFWRYTEFKGLTNLDKAVEHFCNNYERPGTPHMDRRKAAARRVYEAYNK